MLWACGSWRLVVCTQPHAALRSPSAGRLRPCRDVLTPPVLWAFLPHGLHAAPALLAGVLPSLPQITLFALHLLVPCCPSAKPRLTPPPAVLVCPQQRCPTSTSGVLGMVDDIILGGGLFCLQPDPFRRLSAPEGEGPGPGLGWEVPSEPESGKPEEGKEGVRGGRGRQGSWSSKAGEGLSMGR